MSLRMLGKFYWEEWFFVWRSRLLGTLGKIVYIPYISLETPNNKTEFASHRDDIGQYLNDYNVASPGLVV